MPELHVLCTHAGSQRCDCETGRQEPAVTKVCFHITSLAKHWYRMAPRFAARCALLIVPMLACNPSHAEKLTIERIFSAPDLSGPSLRGAQIAPDGKLVTYLRGSEQNKDRLDLWAYDIASGRHRLLVDSARLVPGQAPLSAEEEARRERQRTSSLSGILEYRFSPDGRLLLIPLGGDLYVYDLRAGAGSAVRRITETEEYETDARFSPRGRYVSFIRSQNLFVHDLRTGTEHAITRGGG